MSLNSRRKLKPKDAQRFTAAEPALFAELAMAICQSGVLPEKELHECWQMACRVHEAFPETPNIADLAAGHGLLAYMLVLLARTGAKPFLRTAVSVDITRPKSADILANCLKSRWPELEGAVYYVEASIDAVVADQGPETVFVAIHACGSLSDRVMMAAIASRSSLVIMPCCHSLPKQTATLTRLGAAAGLDANRIESDAAAIDQFRIDSLKALGYQTIVDQIDAEITVCNRMIIGKISHENISERGIQFHRPSTQIKRMGEVRAYEKVLAFNVADTQAARALSQRPEREWKRVFDLSFWLDDDSVGEGLRRDLNELANQGPFNTTVWEQSRYVDPKTQTKSVTYRFEIKSSELPISKDDGLAMRKRVCEAVEGQYRLRI
jgi:hypothetical protein